MYRPEAFRLDDPAALFEHMAAHSFATVITRGEDDDVEVSHLPLLVDPVRRILTGHVARANPQAAHLASGKEVVVIFGGPHGYVSPSVYAEALSVPTWNYVAVHVRGQPRLVDGPGLRAMLEAMVARFDATGWRVPDDEDYLGRMLDAIVGFEVPIERLEGKWKLSQNRSPADQESVVAWLEKGDESSRALAAIMRARLGSS